MTEKTRGAMAGWFGHSAPPTPFGFERQLTLPELQQHTPQETPTEKGSFVQLPTLESALSRLAALAQLSSSKSLVKVAMFA